MASGYHVEVKGGGIGRSRPGPIGGRMMNEERGKARLATVWIGLLLFVACTGGGTDAGDREQEVAVRDEPSYTAQATPERELGDCIQISDEILATKFQDTLKESYRQQGAKLRDARAVKSEDRENIYYVSAEVDAPGLEGDGDYLTWATTSLEPYGGMTYSVDDPTVEFSTWGDGRQTRAELGDMSERGVRESRRCVRGTQ